MPPVRKQPPSTPRPGRRPDERVVPEVTAAAAPVLRAALVVCGGCLALAACLTTEYQAARRQTPPAVPLNLEAAQPPLAASLRTLIVYDGPGSWKRQALWDEYVLTVRNLGTSALVMTAASLIDYAGARREPGDDPWKLEKESQTLEQRYLRDGIAFARSEIPDALVFGAGAVGDAAGTLFSSVSATASSASVVGLPIYYIVVYGVNRNNKATAAAEFARRRLVLPLTLFGGESRTGSLFLPMAPNPQSLLLRWSGAGTMNEMVLPLSRLHGLHASQHTPDAAPVRP